MRVKIGNKIIWFDIAIQPGGTDNHVYLGRRTDKEHYVVDCVNKDLAEEFMEHLLKTGAANLSNFKGNKLDYSNDPGWR